MLNYLIIDDEPLAHNVIEKYSADVPYLVKAGNCFDAIEAINFLNQHSVDLIFLDIQMPKLKGLAFLRSLANPPKVILTTAYKEYALESYELNVLDYLLKPFSFERFVKAVSKALEKQTPAAANSPIISAEQERTHIFVKGDKQYHQLLLEDILHVEAYGGYIKIYLKEQMILSHDQLSSFVQKLPETQFLRVHKSFVVALKKIERIEGNRLFIREKEIPIGGKYRAIIQQMLKG
ncbi:MAG: LytTR family DNA-binding domain-containing protein [Bacteroidota bacterium]